MTSIVRFVCAALLLAGTARAEDKAKLKPTEAKPKIVCEEPVFEFGKRPNTEEVLHSFTIRNDGDAPLELKGVKTSCGCTAAKLKEKIIPPGKSTEISVTVSLKGRRGGQSKSATVKSNDPVKPNLTLTMKGQAIPLVELRPSIVNFNRVVEGAGSETAVDVTFAETPNKIVEVIPKGDFFT
ncbi:MAG: DUF1573 domain-containing protein, partial [Verrucomicrobiota bacterium]